MRHTEIERKFLVDKGVWSLAAKPPGVNCIQGYLCIDEDKAVRVRIMGNKGYITVKGRSATISRPEFEYSIPPDDARELLGLFAANLIEKVRTRFREGDHVWDVDEFHGENEGLLMAEIELEKADEVFDKPAWLSTEVTGDERYYNSYLSINPFGKWK